MEPLPTGRGASSGGGAPPYARHRPERILCHQIVEEYYPAFKAHLAVRGNALPDYVEPAFEGYLKRGRREHGLIPGLLPSALRASLRLFKIAPGDFVCPSCGARRMVESAALPVDEVFPEQPVRQWVLSVPFPLRFLFASRPDVMGRVLG